MMVPQFALVESIESAVRAVRQKRKIPGGPRGEYAECARRTVRLAERDVECVKKAVEG